MLPRHVPPSRSCRHCSTTAAIQTWRGSVVAGRSSRRSKPRSRSPASSVPTKPPRAAYLATIRALLAAGARPELPDERGHDAWEEAAKSDDLEIFELIAATDPDRAARDGERLLAAAVWRGSSLIDVLVERGAPVTPGVLHAAITRDNPKAVERLLALGADPHAVLEGKSVLEWVKDTASRKILQLLKR